MRAFVIFAFVPVRLSFVFSGDSVSSELSVDAFDGQRFASELGKAVEVPMRKKNTIAGHSANPQRNVARMKNMQQIADGIGNSDRRLFMEGQQHFDAASHNWESEDEQTVRRELRQAMAATTAAGVQDPGALLEMHAKRVPDFSKCPGRWQQRGPWCYADKIVDGPCGSRIDLAAMSTEQKIAFERFCKAYFPRVIGGQCTTDFSETCPSDWREIAKNVCEAPDDYDGMCHRYLNTTGMTEMDKRAFSMRCATSWPCVVSATRNYHQICPEGWDLQADTRCEAPASYPGPCAPQTHMGNLSITEKQHFEIKCNVSWPATAPKCKRDYDAHCPYGWRGGGNKTGTPSCTAPSTYTGCTNVKSFVAMTLSEKREWEHTCNAPFPCSDRSSADCTTVWSLPCPADWSIVDGGRACVAPDEYSGNCSVVLLGLSQMNVRQKHDIAVSCGVSWPCFGEVGLNMEMHGSDINPRPHDVPTQGGAFSRENTIEAAHRT